MQRDIFTMRTRTIDNHLNISEKGLVDLVNQLMIKPPKDTIGYYHCCGCGIIYDDPNYKHPVLDHLLLTGKYSLGIIFSDYGVTSGLCEPCYNITMDKHGLRK